MANTLSFFMTPEDELAFLRMLEPLALQAFPEACDPHFDPFRASPANASKFTADAYYLLLTEAGDPVLRAIKRGPHAGMLEIDEIRSPVVHWERSLLDEDGQLRSGRLWAELEAVGDRQHQLRKPDLLRARFEELRSFFKKRFMRSKPVGHFIGPVAARRAREGLVLREAGRKGELVVAYK